MQLFIRETTFRQMHCQMCGIYIYIYKKSYTYSHLDSIGFVMFVEGSSRHQETQAKNITRIAKRCPENITSVVKCLKFLFPKVLLFFLNFNERLHDFCGRGCIIFLTTVSNITAVTTVNYYRH